jgi:hypothetical protein
MQLERLLQLEAQLAAQTNAHVSCSCGERSYFFALHRSRCISFVQARAIDEVHAAAGRKLAAALAAKDDQIREARAALTAKTTEAAADLVALDNRAREAAAEQRSLHEGQVRRERERLRSGERTCCSARPWQLLSLQMRALQACLQSAADQHAQEVADVHRRLAAHAEQVDADHAAAMRTWKAREEALNRRLAEADGALEDARAELAALKEQSAAALKAAEADSKARAGEAVAAAVQQAEIAMKGMIVSTALPFYSATPRFVSISSLVHVALPMLPQPAPQPTHMHTHVHTKCCACLCLQDLREADRAAHEARVAALHSEATEQADRLHARIDALTEALDAERSRVAAADAAHHAAAAQWNAAAQAAEDARVRQVAALTAEHGREMASLQERLAGVLQESRRVQEESEREKDGEVSP